MSPWGYGKCCGPETWSQEFPAAGGEHQSPINIITEHAEHDHNLDKDKLRIKCDEGSYNEQILSFHGHNFKMDGNKNSMTVKGGPLTHFGEFKFVQLHFHWGDSESGYGSEHQINGFRFPSELHMVHFNASKYQTFDEAATHVDGLLVLAILIELGKKNHEIEKLMRPLSSIRCMEKVHLDEDHIHLHLKGLLPHNTDRYFTYSGSLTTPPCYESVTWVVFEHPITVTSDQILQFRWTHLGDQCGTSANFRPECPLNKRKVRKSFS